MGWSVGVEPTSPVSQTGALPLDDDHRGGVRDKTKPAPRLEEPVEGGRTQPCATPVDASDRSPADDRVRCRTRRSSRTPNGRSGRSRRIAVAAWSSLASFCHGRPCLRPHRHGGGTTTHSTCQERACIVPVLRTTPDECHRLTVRYLRHTVHIQCIHSMRSSNG
jgi:hypothetical protein